MIKKFKDFVLEENNMQPLSKSEYEKEWLLKVRLEMTKLRDLYIEEDGLSEAEANIKVQKKVSEIVSKVKKLSKEEIRKKLDEFDRGEFSGLD